LTQQKSINQTKFNQLNQVYLPVGNRLINQILLKRLNVGIKHMRLAEFATILSEHTNAGGYFLLEHSQDARITRLPQRLSEQVPDEGLQLQAQVLELVRVGYCTVGLVVELVSKEFEISDWRASAHPGDAARQRLALHEQLVEVLSSTGYLFTFTL